ncbi:deoxyuridine 5'-triphosphate nucleotidohydrolase [Rhizobium phage B1VFA]|nr:deoxyuridine 5'-triphosphate nucleotidohydrolase [Rhizobium phage B1VFA]
MGASFNEAQQLRVKLLHPDAKIPEYGTEEAAGADLFAIVPEGYHENLIMPGERKLYKTGVAVELTPGTYAEIAPRSGLAFKQGIAVLGGIIDSDYRGDIGVILLNTSREPFILKTGDRIAQLIIKPYVRGVFSVAESLDDTSRGEGGFGSTGK